MSKHENQNTAELLLEKDLDLESRSIYLFKEINQESVAATIKSLHILASKSGDEPIHLFLNSSGGDVTHGFALVDYIQNLSNEVIGIVYGECYSMAVAILQATDARYISKHSSLMIHDGSAEIDGYNKKTRRAWHKFNEQLDNWYEQFILERIKEKHSDFSRARLQSMLISDTILLPEQALELGLVDKII